MDNHLITPEQADTIPALFRARLKRDPNKTAYRQYDVASQQWVSSSWQEMANEVARWQQAFEKEGMRPGDKVAVMLKNSREWVVFDQAALGMGLVTVPLYVDDRPDNVAYIINHAEVQLLFLQDKLQWKRLLSSGVDLGNLKKIISIKRISEDDEPDDKRLESLSDWLFGLQGELQAKEGDADSLASIVYTSGTTGRAKGVMLSHKNIVFDTFSALSCHDWKADEVFLSFLPLSHMLERMAGYYMAMAMGAEVAYARSIPQLGNDLVNIRPTVLVSVPRIYERVYGKIQDGLKDKSPFAKFLFNAAVKVGWKQFLYEQGRARWSPQLLFWPILNKLVARKVMDKLGGRMRAAICGGAALSEEVARLFIGLGLSLTNGYGLTETSPVISVNREDDNIPASIGTVIPGVEVRIGDDDELQTRSDAVMMGYWKNEEATREAFTEDGWFRTGDKACIDEQTGHLYLTGRLKDIIVLANGEKVPPNDMELAVALDGLFEQVMIIGEARPYLCAIIVLHPDAWVEFATAHSVHPESPEAFRHRNIERAVLDRVAARLKEFPGYAKVRRVTLTLEPWTVDDGLLTPTLKIKRPKVMEKFCEEIEIMYQGH